MVEVAGLQRLLGLLLERSDLRVLARRCVDLGQKVLVALGDLAQLLRLLLRGDVRLADRRGRTPAAPRG